jgi:hypothetical protein
MGRWSRRRVLAVSGLVATGGCLDSGSGGDPTGTGSRSPDSASPTGASTHRSLTPTGETTDLDLQEANVVGVEWDGRPGEEVDFSVTLYHDDDGESGYANWWQVERLDGERLGRRDLLHAHGTRPFTRSATFAVGSDVTCVVVRGHDETHGYGGRAVLLSIGTGEARAVRQGPAPTSLADADCP